MVAILFYYRDHLDGWLLLFCVSMVILLCSSLSAIPFLVFLIRILIKLQYFCYLAFIKMQIWNIILQLDNLSPSRVFLLVHQKGKNFKSCPIWNGIIFSLLEQVKMIIQFTAIYFHFFLLLFLSAALRESNFYWLPAKEEKKEDHLLVLFNQYRFYLFIYLSFS